MRRYLLTLSLILNMEKSFLTSLNSGDYGDGETPLPIPNREVKPVRADGTARFGEWESKSSPEFFILAPFVGLFYFLP